MIRIIINFIKYIEEIGSEGIIAIDKEERLVVLILNQNNKKAKVYIVM